MDKPKKKKKRNPLDKIVREFLGNADVLKAVKKNSLDALATELLAETSSYENDDGPYSTEIIDERQTHVHDNGAMMSIADSAPVYPEDMGDSYEPTGPDQVLGGENIRGVTTEVFRDDFHDLIRDQAKAAVGPGGEHLDDFDQKFQLQRGVHEDLHEEAAFTRDNPPSVLSGILGGQALIDLNQQPATVAYWTGHDAETTPVTCTFATIQTFKRNPNAITTGARPYGIVQFGTRGFLETIEVDIALGAQFTVSGSQVVLQVMLDASGGAVGPLALSGMLSFKTTQKSLPLTRTRYVDNLNPGSVAAFAATVPKYAKSLTVWRNDISVPISIDVFDSGNAASLYTVNLGSGQDMMQMRAVPLSGDAAQITITNRGSYQINAKLIFNLVL